MKAGHLLCASAVLWEGPHDPEGCPGPGLCLSVCPFYSSTGDTIVISGTGLRSGRGCPPPSQGRPRLVRRAAVCHWLSEVASAAPRGPGTGPEEGAVTPPPPCGLSLGEALSQGFSPTPQGTPANRGPGHTVTPIDTGALLSPPSCAPGSCVGSEHKQGCAWRPLRSEPPQQRTRLRRRGAPVPWCPGRWATPGLSTRPPSDALLLGARDRLFTSCPGGTFQSWQSARPLCLEASASTSHRPERVR